MAQCALVGRGETGTGRVGPGDGRSAVGLNSRNSNNSYSERGQHRGTRRCGSR